jgi:DNA-binding transcriptional ArsR family regulator
MQKINENLYKAIGNSERVRLLICLEKEQTVSELLLKCHLSQSALSQHLKILKEADLVGCRRDGKHQYYKVRNKKILNFCTTLQTFE